MHLVSLRPANDDGRSYISSTTSARKVPNTRAAELAPGLFQKILYHLLSVSALPSTDPQNQKLRATCYESSLNGPRAERDDLNALLLLFCRVSSCALSSSVRPWLSAPARPPPQTYQLASRMTLARSAQQHKQRGGHSDPSS